MYNDSITLIKRDYKTVDFEDIPVETKTDVLCKVQSIGRNEFYLSKQAGLDPVAVFIVKSYEYNGEDTVEFEGQRYRVIKTYRVNFEETELTVERVIE